MDVLSLIEEEGNESGRVKNKVEIVDCGIIESKPEKKWFIINYYFIL